MAASREGEVYVSATWAFLRPPSSFQAALTALDAELTALSLRHQGGDLQLLFILTAGNECRFDEVSRARSMTVASVLLGETALADADVARMLETLRFWMVVAYQRAVGRSVVDEQAPHQMNADEARERLAELVALGDSGTSHRRVDMRPTWTFAIRVDSAFATDEAERTRLTEFEDWAESLGLRLEGHEIGEHDWTIRIEGRRKREHVASLQAEAARRGLAAITSS